MNLTALPYLEGLEDPGNEYHKYTELKLVASKLCRGNRPPPLMRGEGQGCSWGCSWCRQGMGLAELAWRTRHLLLLVLLREWRGKEVAMTSAVSVCPTSPGRILVAAVSLSLQGFGIK